MLIVCTRTDVSEIGVRVPVTLDHILRPRALSRAGLDSTFIHDGCIAI